VRSRNLNNQEALTRFGPQRHRTKNSLYNFRVHERYLTELETINATERTGEERMIDKIILWNEIPNAENTIFCNTSMFKERWVAQAEC
jgi:hypothetical protein